MFASATSRKRLTQPLIISGLLSFVLGAGSSGYANPRVQSYIWPSRAFTAQYEITQVSESPSRTRYLQNYDWSKKKQAMPLPATLTNIKRPESVKGNVYTPQLASVAYASYLRQGRRSFSESPYYEDDTLLLVAGGNLDEEAIENSMERVHGTVLNSFVIGDKKVLKIRTERHKLADTERQLRSDKNFRGMQRNWRCVWATSNGPVNKLRAPAASSGAYEEEQGSAGFSDPFYPRQWYLQACNIPAALNISGGKSVPMALLDSGCNEVDDLKRKLEDGDNQIVQGGALMDNGPKAGHGTSMASVCVAAGGNGVNTVGVNPSASLLPMRISSANAPTDEDILHAMYYLSVKHPEIKIVVIGCTSALGDSLAAHPVLQPVFSMFSGVGFGLIFLPAGNVHRQITGGTEPYIVTVAASDPTGNPCSFTNYGPGIKFLAPGKDICTSDKEGSVINVSGTSYSAAIAASIASMVWGIKPALSADKVVKILSASATGGGRNFGSGIIDAKMACELARNQ